MNHYSEAILLIRNAILKSRYRAAALANRELLSLYYGIGKFISENSRKGFWGTGAIETISERLQQELPGLRGFSTGNIKRMRIFFEEWREYIENRTPTVYDLENQENQSIANRTLITHDLETSVNLNAENRLPMVNEIEIDLLIEIRPLVTDEFQNINLHRFLSIGFSLHYEIIAKTKSLEERIFYIESCATEFWSRETLKYHLKSNLYEHCGKMQNNFQATISDKDLQRRALLSFKDELLLDYINIETADDEPDERVLESEIV